MSEGVESRFSYVKAIPFILLIALSAAGIYFFGDLLNAERLAENQSKLLSWRDQNYLLSALVFITLYTIIVAFSLPGAAIASVTGGFLFGLTLGTLFNVTSATMGAIAIFSAARFGFGASLSEKMDNSSGAVKRFKEGLKSDEISYLLMMRLIPAVPFFVANLLPALVGVSLFRFIWTTFLGIIPGAIVFTWIGVGLSEVLARGELPNLGLIFEPYVLGPLIGLALLSGLPILVKRLRG